ncbi:MAG: 16S rRNA (guanine(966)-N(2))-methyltransferase RsmD [Bacilli bacterium]
MRIIAGKYRHRLIEWPNDIKNIRPTKDRIREAIFSSIGDLSSLRVLDLYAGSGAMGLESLSRNAQHATFVDYNQMAIETIHHNLQSLHIGSDEVSVLRCSDHQAIDTFIQKKESFDVVFLDPPYQMGEYQSIIDLLLNNNLLTTHGIIVIETQQNIEFKNVFYRQRKDYHYGDIIVTILWR